MVLRCTRRLLDLLGSRVAPLTEAPPTDDDWYGNLLWLDRQKCLLLTHAYSLFSIFQAGIRKDDGFMNEMAVHLRYQIADADGLNRCDISVLNHRLRRTLHDRAGYVYPIELVAERLAARA